MGLPVTAKDRDGDALSYRLGLEDEAANYLLFDYVTSTGQLMVNDAGANGLLGLDADAPYPVVMTAADGRGGWDAITVGVYLDANTKSPAGDGVCP